MPQNMWYHTKYESLLNYHYYEASKINKNKDCCEMELSDIIKPVYVISMDEE